VKFRQAQGRSFPLLVAVAALAAVSLGTSVLGAPAAAALIAPAAQLAAGQPAAAQPAAVGCTQPAGAVSCTPTHGTPQLAPNARGTVEQIRQLVQAAR
jgi:hypothetical protein